MSYFSPQQSIIAAQRCALRHVKNPPRQMVTLAYAHNAVAAAYMSVFKRMGGILGIPLDGVNVDGATLAGIKVMDDDVFKTVFKGTAYPIPEGETYLLRHQGNGIFTIINQDGHYAGFSVDDNDGSE